MKAEHCRELLSDLLNEEMGAGLVFKVKKKGLILTK